MIHNSDECQVTLFNTMIFGDNATFKNKIKTTLKHIFRPCIAKIS